MNRGLWANDGLLSSAKRVMADAAGIMVLFRDDGMEMERFLPRIRQFL
jgi:hypothetical protein